MRTPRKSPALRDLRTRRKDGTRNRERKKGERANRKLEETEHFKKRKIDDWKEKEIKITSGTGLHIKKKK